MVAAHHTATASGVRPGQIILAGDTVDTVEAIINSKTRRDRRDKTSPHPFLTYIKVHHVVCGGFAINAEPR